MGGVDPYSIFALAFPSHFEGIKKPLKVRGRQCKNALDQPLPHLTESLCRNWHLDFNVWLPGFIGPYPSTSLDKSLVAI